MCTSIPKDTLYRMLGNWLFFIQKFRDWFENSWSVFVRKSFCLETESSHLLMFARTEKKKKHKTETVGGMHAKDDRWNYKSYANIHAFKIEEGET
jgi:hypothetical protein